MIINMTKIERKCCLYVSDFHLEMILLPYLKEKEKIIIKTEKNLEESINILLSRVNFKEEEKEKIKNLNWKNQNQKLESNSNIIVIGSRNFIEEENKKIKNCDLCNISIVDCFYLEEVKDCINELKERYDFCLNSYGEINL